MTYHELVIRLDHCEDDEVLAVARGVRVYTAAPTVDVYRVEPGKTFADTDERRLLETVEES